MNLVRRRPVRVPQPEGAARVTVEAPNRQSQRTTRHGASRSRSRPVAGSSAPRRGDGSRRASAATSPAHGRRSASSSSSCIALARTALAPDSPTPTSTRSTGVRPSARTGSAPTSVGRDAAQPPDLRRRASRSRSALLVVLFAIAGRAAARPRSPATSAAGRTTISPRSPTRCSRSRRSRWRSRSPRIFKQGLLTAVDRDRGHVRARLRAAHPVAGARGARGDLRRGVARRSASATAGCLRKHISPERVAPLVVQIALAFGYALLRGSRPELPRLRRAAPDTELGHDAPGRVQRLHQRDAWPVYPARRRDPRSRCSRSTSSPTACATRSAARASGRPRHDRASHAAVSRRRVDRRAARRRRASPSSSSPAGGWLRVVDDVAFDVAPGEVARCSSARAARASRCRRSR